VTIGSWVLERGASTRFPYRVRIIAHDGRELLKLRVQDRWPAANRNIFCLREEASSEDGSPLEEVERVPVLNLHRRGIRVSIVLDRKRYKRCDFLFLTKPYKNRPGQSYEQIYWQTQTSMVQRRPKAVAPSINNRAKLTVTIDSGERYPWRFGASETRRARLPVGDYALVDESGLVAVVERKTFENLLANFGVMPLLHQRLTELSGHVHNALVVEAPYEDFLNPKRLHHYSPSYCAAAIADLYASHPRLRIVFCANRKTANLWTQSFFHAVWQLALEASADPSPLHVGEALPAAPPRIAESGR
jgi:ERCC4 domain